MGLNPTEDAVMIGAGPAAATGLRGRDIPVVILEASDRFAALRRARHPQVRQNIHRRLARLPTSRCSS